MQTSLGALTIEQAKPDELRVVIDIIDEAAAWLHAKDITKQWPSPTPQSFAEFMEKQIARGDVYLARIDGDAIGTLGTLLAAWPEASAHKRWVMAATPVLAAAGK